MLECSRNGAPIKSLEGLEYLINLKKFEVHADLIAGLPLYTYKDLLSDVITLMEVKPGEIQLELLKLLPGTYFRDNADLYNIKYSPLPPYEVLETNNISYYELNKAVVLSKILDRWYNNSIWRDILVLYINNSLEKLADFVESLSKTDFAYKSYSQEYLSLLLFNFIKNEESTSFEFKKIWIENGMSLKKEPDRKSTRLNASHLQTSRLPTCA